MTKNFVKGFFLLVVAVPLLSCATVRVVYRYGNVNYDQPEPALAAQKVEIDNLVGSIPPTDHPIGGSAVVIVPSVSSAMKTLVFWKWKGPDFTPEQMESAMKFTATTIVYEFRGKGEAIQKRRIFDHVTIVASDSPENAAFSEDTAIVLLVKNGKPGWFVKKAADEGGAPTEREIGEIAKTLPPLQTQILWLDEVEKILRSN